MLVVPDEGERYLLRLMLKNQPSGVTKFLLGLYANDWSPLKESVLADVTAATFAGYSSVDLLRSAWVDPLTVEGVARSVYGTVFQQWVPTSGSEEIFGYYVRDQDSAVLLWAERFAASILASPILPVVMKPVLQLHSESQP